MQRFKTSFITKDDNQKTNQRIGEFIYNQASICNTIKVFAATNLNLNESESRKLRKDLRNGIHLEWDARK